MEKEKHLPIFGVGPYLGAIIILFTVLGVILSVFGFLDSGLINIKWLRILFIILGSLIILEGFTVWAKAALGKKNIDYYIKNNILCTKGIYSICRNPCYSGIALMCTGIILIINNFWLFFLPFIFWILITIVMKYSEEKWLIDKYGDEYKEYCKKVNRCFPWFNKRK